MEKVFILGSMERFMMVNGFKDLRMDSELGKGLMEIFTKEIGAIINAKGMGNMSGLMETSMRVNGCKVLSKDKAMIALLMETSIQESI